MHSRANFVSDLFYTFLFKMWSGMNLEGARKKIKNVRVKFWIRFTRRSCFLHSLQTILAQPTHVRTVNVQFSF